MVRAIGLITSIQMTPAPSKPKKEGLSSCTGLPKVEDIKINKDKECVKIPTGSLPPPPPNHGLQFPLPTGKDILGMIFGKKTETILDKLPGVQLPKKRSLEDIVIIKG